MQWNLLGESALHIMETNGTDVIRHDASTPMCVIFWFHTSDDPGIFFSLVTSLCLLDLAVSIENTSPHRTVCSSGKWRRWKCSTAGEHRYETQSSALLLQPAENTTQKSMLSSFSWTNSIRPLMYNAWNSNNTGGLTIYRNQLSVNMSSRDQKKRDTCSKHVWPFH